MTWWGWLIFAGYWIVALFVWRTAAYIIAHDSYGPPDAEDVGIGIMLGALAAAIWPLTVGIYIAAHNDVFLRAPRHVRLAEREQRIAALEKELGIHD